MDILNDIDIWLIGLEHNDKLKTVMRHIQSPHNPVLRKRNYKDREKYLYFGNFLLYHTITYKPSDRH